MSVVKVVVVVNVVVNIWKIILFKENLSNTFLVDVIVDVVVDFVVDFVDVNVVDVDVFDEDVVVNIDLREHLVRQFFNCCSI